MALCEQDEQLDFIFGLAGNQVLTPKAEPLLNKARALRQSRLDNARRTGAAAPGAVRLYDDVDYKARSWAKTYRVVLKAEVMTLGANPRFVVTSLGDPSPEALYRDLYCARGQDENFIKAVKNDLASERTSDHAFLANHLRLFYACAAYSLRENTLCHTELARAQPMSIILKLFKLAVRVVQPDQVAPAKRLPGQRPAAPRQRTALPRPPACPRLTADGERCLSNRNALIWPLPAALARLAAAIQGAPLE